MHGDNITRFAAGSFQFTTQVADVAVDGAFVAFEGNAVDRSEKLGARVDLSF